MIDEGDTSFHPAWKKKYIKALIIVLPKLFEKLIQCQSINVIFTTHDPLTLSDIANRNVLFLKKDRDGNVSILDYKNSVRSIKTFAANVSEILADSFFVNDSLIGEFSSFKILHTIKEIEDIKIPITTDEIDKINRLKKTIETIDEPIIQRKIAELLATKTDFQFYETIIDKQIEQLQRLKQKRQ